LRSISDAEKASFLKKLAIPFAFAIALSAAALLQGRLDITIALFLAMVLSLSVIRTVLTRGTPLPIASAFSPTREKCLVTLVAVGMMWLPIVMIATPFLDFAAYTLPPAVPLVGAILAVLGLWLFYRSHVDLGPYWSPMLEIRDAHVLITDGVYRRVRHPMYTALFLITGAQASFLQNWLAGPAGIVAFLILYLVRVGPEEEMMEETFGDDYRNYSERTGRLIPKITS
ncbi:MAG: protein-S-isoprenylcysteine O-methyltransferase, partial [Pseudomonadota bacterium]